MNDIVGINIVQHGGGRIFIAQRRAEALDIIKGCSGDSTKRVVFNDLVGNPVLIDISLIASATLMAVEVGPKLLADLSPVPPTFDVQKSAPELVAKPVSQAQPGGGVRAGDLDPVERAQGR